MALVTEKYQKCQTKIIFGERWQFLFWEFKTVFSRKKFISPAIWKSHKNSKTRGVFKGSEVFFSKIPQKTILYEFSNSGKISSIKT